eukprot:2446329-Alexandrium_andersonii.AAC.1
MGLDHMVNFLADSEPGTDVAEICGGRARVTRVCVRRRLRGGKNFDVECGVDLLEPAQQRALWAYLRRGVWVVIMSPPCTAFGPWSRINRWRAPEAWAASLEVGEPLAALCGQ